MKTFYTLIKSLFVSMIFPALVVAQGDWPRSFTTGDGQMVKVYQWQPESFSNGQLQANAAISVTQNGQSEPQFGMIWLNANTNTSGQQVVIRNVEVNSIRLPNENDESRLSALQSAIANGMSNRNISFTTSELNSALQNQQEERQVSSGFNNNPPKIIYSDKPSILVIMDGAPRVQMNSYLGVETVINTPFTIIKANKDYYLYGGKHWYMAGDATGPYRMTTSIPSALKDIQSKIAQSNTDNNVQQEENDYVISNIIVSTEPAELLQSNGEPNFMAIPQTNLLYVNNSNNDIFMDVATQQYYILLSGRWYKSTALSGKWNYVASDRLPADFAKIPEGSPKDNVLSSVAGTLPANNALLDAQVPQTAKVDRKTANADIQYDGNPQFADIDGTDMSYAVNTPDYVIRWRGTYYAVENGVWFQSYSATGPWVVSTVRPPAVSLIPPSYPVYAMKYVYIYDVTPDYIYMGYTPGYLNTFIYGPTVVYGTGYYYRPWFGSYYYARPYTWGFNMHYNPFVGWSFGFNYNVGWFHFSMGNYNPWAWGGWWGPSIFRPVYYPAPYYRGYQHGYYGYNNYGRRNTTVINNINIYRTTNIYNYRRDVVTRDNRRTVSTNRSATSSAVRSFNNPRPTERVAGRNSNNNSTARPVERRTTTPSGNANTNTRPSGSQSNRVTNGSGTANGSNRISQGSNRQVTRPSVEQRTTERSSPTVPNVSRNTPAAGNTGSGRTVERTAPAVRPDAGRSNLLTDRNVQQNVQQNRVNNGASRTPAPQRVTSPSIRTAPSGNSGRSVNRSAGNGEIQNRRG